MILFHTLRDLADSLHRNNILSITPSETFQIEDGIELTPAERKEAEQMQKEEQLRRRDPKAHMAMILGRRERELQSLQQDAVWHNPPPTAPVHPMTSTQRVRWDTPMIATGDMLRPPSTASDATLDDGSALNAPLVVSPSVVVSPNLHQPDSGPVSSSISKTGKGASVPAPKQTPSGFVAPRRLSGTSKFSVHDLQNHIDNPIGFLANNQVAQSEEALREAIGNLFGEGPLDGSSINKGMVPKALQKATREEFQAIISRKCLGNKYEHMGDSLRSFYARGLRSFIVQKAKTEEEHRRLASGMKRLLDRESISPAILLKVLSDRLGPAKSDAPTDVVADGQLKPDDTMSGQSAPVHGQTDGSTEKAVPTAKQHPGNHKSDSVPISGLNGHMSEKNENKGGRKRTLAADDKHSNKKMRRAPASAPKSPSLEMEKTFENLLSREAARSSRG